jgi:hypothetical protein
MFAGFKNFLMQGQLVVVGVGLVAVFADPPPTKACLACLSDGLPLEATKCRYCATALTVEASGGLAEPA